MPGRSRGSSRRARPASSRLAAQPMAAPSRPRVPVSASAISRSAGYPARPSGCGSSRSSSGCGQCRGSSPSCSRRTRRSAARRSAPRSTRLSQRPRHYLEQRLQRRRAQTAAQVPQRFLRRQRQVQASQPGGQLRPDPRASQPREHPEREHEVHPGSRGQAAQPPLHGPGKRLRRCCRQDHARRHRSLAFCYGPFDGFRQSRKAVYAARGWLSNVISPMAEMPLRWWL